MKKLLSDIAIFITICLCFTSCSSNMSDDELAKVIGTNKFPVDMYHASYAIDVSDLKAVVGDSDYVVVAKVTDYISTTYSASGIPLTEYAVQVVENIKGKLDTTKEISIVKEGGLNEEKNKFVIYENDLLPQVGQYYIFCIYAQSTGINRVCGESCTLTIANRDNYLEDKNYVDICDAYAEEIVSTRERYRSQNEIG